MPSMRRPSGRHYTRLLLLLARLLRRHVLLVLELRHLAKHDGGVAVEERNAGETFARLELVDIFTGQKISHVGSVTDSINVPLIEKGTAMVTHIEGAEVHAMNMRDHSMMILPLEEEMEIDAGKEIMWMEALGLYKIIRDH